MRSPSVTPIAPLASASHAARHGGVLAASESPTDKNDGLRRTSSDYSVAVAVAAKERTDTLRFVVVGNDELTFVGDAVGVTVRDLRIRGLVPIDANGVQVAVGNDDVQTTVLIQVRPVAVNVADVDSKRVATSREQQAPRCNRRRRR